MRPCGGAGTCIPCTLQYRCTAHCWSLRRSAGGGAAGPTSEAAEAVEPTSASQTGGSGALGCSTAADAAYRALLRPLQVGQGGLFFYNLKALDP